MAIFAGAYLGMKVQQEIKQVHVRINTELLPQTVTAQLYAFDSDVHDLRYFLA